MNLRPTKVREFVRGSDAVQWIKPGETITGFLCPELDYETRPGRYLVKVASYLEIPGTGVVHKVKSDRIAKTSEAKSR